MVRVFRLILIIALGWCAAAQPATAQNTFDYNHWAADATHPGPLLPPQGRSLFDYLMTEPAGAQRVWRVPFPFSALVERIQQELVQSEYGGGTRIAMIPMGRSLQRSAAAPEFFKYPRIVFAVTGESKGDAQHPGMLLKDRLYIGYVESTNTLEVISYNEAAGRYEFQLVKDYRAGGQPKVYYANRAICIACHQNHAPIFSKAVWSETNANLRIAELLGAARADFYQLPPQANLDFPDDIGQSSVRANALVTHQFLWRHGCESSDAGDARRCRAAALEAVLQYALSGEYDVGSSSPRFQSDFVPAFSQTWRKRWPAGLQVAQAELPDRSPVGQYGASYRAASATASAPSDPATEDFIAASHVSAALDPLSPRAPRETWRFAGALDAHRYVQGWSRVFAPADLRTLDAQLTQRARNAAVTRTPYTSTCRLSANAHSAYTLKIDCEASEATGFALRGKFHSGGGGLVDLINLGAAGQIRDAELQTEAAQCSAGRCTARAMLKRKQLTARLADGRAIADITLRWQAASGAELASGTELQIQLQVQDDFSLLRAALDALLDETPALFDAAPLKRNEVLRALYAKLGLSAALTWCCDAAGMPPAHIEPATEPAGELPAAWQALYHNCATCHVSAEQFPPNFLAGDVRRVERNLRHCAPRMLVRLAAWTTPAAQRVKTPMPPETFLPAVGAHPAQWSNGEEYQALRAYVEALLRETNQPAQAETLLRDGYEALPACLAKE